MFSTLVVYFRYSPSQNKPCFTVPLEMPLNCFSSQTLTAISNSIYCSMLGLVAHPQHSVLHTDPIYTLERPYTHTHLHHTCTWMAGIRRTLRFLQICTVTVEILFWTIEHANSHSKTLMQRFTCHRLCQAHNVLHQNFSMPNTFHDMYYSYLSDLHSRAQWLECMHDELINLVPTTDVGLTQCSALD